MARGVAIVGAVLLGLLVGGALPAGDLESDAGQESPPTRDAMRVLVPSAPELAARVRILYHEGSEGRAERTARVLERHHLLPGLPPGVPARAEIVLAPDSVVWNEWTGGEVPHWGAGVAIPSLDRIVLPLFRAPWTGGVSEDRTLRHEWAHLGLHDHLRGHLIPRWFDEGYAQWASGGWDATSAWRLRVALARRNAAPLEALALTWPRGRGEAELAYLLAASAVSFLASEGGERGIERLLERWGEAGSFDDAFRATYGMTPTQFEVRWIRHARSRYGWLVFLSQTTFIWGILGIGLISLFWIRRRRDRERMDRLRRSESTDETSWWSPFR